MRGAGDCVFCRLPVITSPWLLMMRCCLRASALQPPIAHMQALTAHTPHNNPEGRWPALDRWFEAMESRPTYLGTRSDHYTHCHDLPPQLGGKGWIPDAC